MEHLFLKYIAEQLSLEGASTLPGIGILTLSQRAAQRLAGGVQLSAPAPVISFREATRVDDLSLLAYIEKRRPGIAGLQEQWQLFSDRIREKTAGGGSWELPGIGVLEGNEQGNISFRDYPGDAIAEPVVLPGPVTTTQAEHSSRKAAAPSTAGEAASPAEATSAPPPVAAAPEPTEMTTALASETPAAPETAAPSGIAPSSEAPKASETGTAPEAVTTHEVPDPAPEYPDLYPYPLPEERSGKRLQSWWIAAAVLIVAGILFFLLYRPQRERQIRPEAATPAADSTAAEAGASSSAADQPAGNDSLHYHIVIATYPTLERGGQQYRKFRSWGLPVELLAEDSSTFRLAMPFTSMPADTALHLKEMKALYGQDAFIVYK
ncbi:hypothetical protein [Compostibacter hankyongensis]|uniref:CCDC81-like prokaryotic HU domain-containing protein n=1 Tax=Compostibacter hankyongensis TaxID=1007089 RepID=A0ABP8G2C2_9BACT